MRLCVIATVLVALLMPSVAHAQAQSELERLRRALRQVTTQLRTAEDQRVALQAQATQAEREKERLNLQINSLKGELKNAQETYEKTVEEFNQRMAERDQTLDKWRSAYEEAADVARTKEAERIKNLTDATTYKARTFSCEARNKQLLKVGQEMLAGYRDLTLGEIMAIKEPAIGIARVDHQNRTQDFRDRILDNDAKMPITEPTAATDQKPGQTQNSKDQKPADKKPAARRADRKNDEKKNEPKSQPPSETDETAKGGAKTDDTKKSQKINENGKDKP
jgi:regulator of replication initiation timing